jgi:hypothetical protein
MGNSLGEKKSSKFPVMIVRMIMMIKMMIVRVIMMIKMMIVSVIR